MSQPDPAEVEDCRKDCALFRELWTAPRAGYHKKPSTERDGRAVWLLYRKGEPVIRSLLCRTNPIDRRIQ
jgi:hypothetical protein